MTVVPMFAFLGTQEIVVILVIALIVFGPQKLPEIGRQIGTAMRELRKMSGDVQKAFDFDDLGASMSSPSYDNHHWDDSQIQSQSPTIIPQHHSVSQDSTAGYLESGDAWDAADPDGDSIGAFAAPPGPLSLSPVPAPTSARIFEYREPSQTSPLSEPLELAPTEHFTQTELDKEKDLRADTTH